MPHAQARHWQNRFRRRSQEVGRRPRSSRARSSSTAPMLLDPPRLPRLLSRATVLARVLVGPPRAGVQQEEVVTHPRAPVHSGRMDHRVRVLLEVGMGPAVPTTETGSRRGTAMRGGGNGRGVIGTETGSGTENAAGGSRSSFGVRTSFRLCDLTPLARTDQISRSPRPVHHHNRHGRLFSILFSCGSSCTSCPVSLIHHWSALRSSRTSCLSLFRLAVCSFDDPLSFYPIRSSVVLVLCVLLFRDRLFSNLCLLYCMTLHLRTPIAD